MKNKTITLSEYFQILIKKIIETEAEQFDIPITHVHTAYLYGLQYALQ
jgi:hypothetical protein